MNIKHLQLTHMRAFDQAEFDFNPGMNLLVGVNGVGKTTVLDALRICISKILPAVTASRSRSLPFDAEDIRGNAAAMTVRLFFELEKRDFEFLVHKQRERSVVHKQRERSVAHKAGEVRQQTRNTPDQETCTPALSVLGEDPKGAARQPLGIFFSTRRSLVSDAMPSSGSAAGGQAVAFADALASRELRLAELAYWMHAQEELTGRASPGEEAPCRATACCQGVSARVQESLRRDLSEAAVARDKGRCAPRCATTVSWRARAIGAGIRPGETALTSESRVVGSSEAGRGRRAN